MATKCRSQNSRGLPCQCFARLDSDEGLCLFHSRRSAPGVQRKPEPLTKADLIKMLDQTIRAVKNAKKLNPLERSRELRALIVQRDQLLAEPESKEPGWKEKVDTWKRTSSAQ
jgi:hypothetical protein